MSKIQYVVHVEALDANVCHEVVEEFDGTLYRAKIIRGNSRSFQAELLEPFEQLFSVELPLFVLGFTQLRLVRDGKPTQEMERMIRTRMAQLHKGRQNRELQ